MAKLLGMVANGAGLLGIVICLIAGVSRLAGSYHVIGYEALTLFIGGIALMVMACLIKLHQLTRG